MDHHYPEDKQRRSQIKEEAFSKANWIVSQLTIHPWSIITKLKTKMSWFLLLINFVLSLFVILSGLKEVWNVRNMKVGCLVVTESCKAQNTFYIWKYIHKWHHFQNKQWRPLLERANAIFSLHIFAFVIFLMCRKH